MANVTGFLLRTNLDDQGTLPRSGSWTGCPDICVGGTAPISQNDLIGKYGQVFDATLTQALENNIYVRAKNMNSAPLSQKVFLFQVPGSLVLRPELWYSRTNLLPFVPAEGDPTDPSTWVYNQVISAGAGNITATGAFNWKPQTTEHHCLVAVVADSWDSVLSNYPAGGGSMDGLAKWIYASGNLGWHNVNIKAVTSTVYEDWTGYSNSDQKDERVTFTMIANNVPVGARISFSSNTSTKSGEVIGQDWVNVPTPPGQPDAKVNPDFEVGSTVMVDATFETVITYRTDFNGKPVPKGFAQAVQATVVTSKPAPKNLMMSRFIANDTFAASYARSFSPNALFRGSTGEVYGVGYDGFVRMMAATGEFAPERRVYGVGGGPPNGGGHHIGNTAIVVIGSNTTRPDPA